MSAQGKPVAIAEDKPLLDIVGVTIAAGRQPGAPKILRDVTLSLRRGAILGLVGESGAGKSMIGRLIGRQLPPQFQITAGKVLFEGADLLAMPARTHRDLLGRRIAFIPQEPMSALNPVVTVGDQICEHLSRLDVPPGQQRARAAEALAEVKIPAPADVLDKYPFQLSGGMCQRVMIAMAFLSDPDLVISDEATTALDVTTQTHIVRLLRSLQQRRGTAIIFITHDLRLAAHVCDEVAVLYAGDVFEAGDAKAVLAAPRHPYTRALNAANPPLGGPVTELSPLPGQMPSPADLKAMTGCRLTPRCPLVTPECGKAVPPLASVGENQAIRCIREIVPQTESGKLRTLGNQERKSALLTVEHLGKSYTMRRGWRDVSRVDAVIDASFTVGVGEFVGIVGESGSGKSTIGRLVMGLETADNGAITLGDTLLTNSRADWLRRIAAIQFVFQDPRSALNPRRRVASLVTQSMEAKTYLQTDRKRRADELLQNVGMSPAMGDRFSRQMSGGQRQRVNIARALCEMPQLLIADEIVSGLDVLVQAQILNLLLALRAERNIALLFISHDLGVVRYLCDRVIVMQRGRIVESGPTEAVFQQPAHAYTKELLASVPPEDWCTPWPA